MSAHATPFAKTVGFGGRCSCGGLKEATADGTTFCQVCDDPTQEVCVCGHDIECHDTIQDRDLHWVDPGLSIGHCLRCGCEQFEGAA